MRSPQIIPKIIYLDAVGTLFGVRGSVGEQYAIVAENFGVKLDHELINQAFYQSFQAAPKMAFPDLPQSDLPLAEYEWWRSLAKQTFGQTGDLIKFADFDAFFKSLYAYFASDAPWFIYEDVRFALNVWKQQGVILGLLSNFDSRLYAVIKALELESYFDSITISTEAGAAKPSSQIFEVALAKHQIQNSPEMAWHIGDSFKDDYEGAKAVGIKPILIKRDKILF